MKKMFLVMIFLLVPLFFTPYANADGWHVAQIVQTGTDAAKTWVKLTSDDWTGIKWFYLYADREKIMLSVFLTAVSMDKSVYINELFMGGNQYDNQIYSVYIID